MSQETIHLSTSWIPLESIAPFLPDNPIIVEAGAHNGKTTLRIKKYWPKSTIHAFEPVPGLCKELRARNATEPSIFCHEIALSDTIGTATMYVSSGKTDACSSLLQPHQNLKQERPNVFFDTTITVNTTTLDAWANKHAIHNIDFLWLDMQGAELQVLQGAQHILNNVKVIHTEINLVERYVGAAMYDKLKNFLIEHGFYLHIKGLGKYAWGNALFVRSNKLDQRS